MTNSITFFFLFALITIALFAHLFQSIRKILKIAESVQKFIKRSNKWPVTTGTIEKIEINMDYPWPNNTLNGEDIDEIDEKRKHAESSEIIQGIVISYSYSVNDEPFKSTSIQIVPTKKILNLALTKNLGDKIDVFYNPKLKSESILIKSDEDDVGDYTWILLKDLRTPFIFSLSSFFMTMILLLSTS